jgi:hypothetical protein
LNPILLLIIQILAKLIILSVKINDMYTNLANLLFVCVFC